MDEEMKAIEKMRLEKLLKDKEVRIQLVASESI